MEKEEELKHLAHRVTNELEEHLGEGAEGVSFGIGEEKGDTEEKQPLSWAQLAELLVCLQSRDLLPSSLSKEDVKTVTNHVAWRWFENLRHPVLAKAAMWRFADRLVDSLERKVNEGVSLDDSMEITTEEKCAEEPWLCIFSAHDSTLIGLLCILQLEMPSVWPEYGSALKVELIQEEEGDKVIQHWVRFSLNGQVLRCLWLPDNDGKPSAMVPLEKLADMIHDEHRLYEDDEESELKYSWRDGQLTEH